ncbi:MAG: hypothetical protein AAGE18_19120 [Pseudomonadota bacterium]
MAAPRAESVPKNAWLAETRPADQVFIVSLRRWLEGPGGQRAVWLGLASELGQHQAHEVLAALEAFLAALAMGLRRQLLRHAAHCPCLGEDEALLAEIVRHAARGDRETALCRAAEVVREPDLIVTVERAARLGSLFEDLAVSPPTPANTSVTLH